MKQELFEKMKNKVREELEIDEFSAPVELKNVQKKWHYWHSEYISEKNILDGTIERMEKIAFDITYGMKIGRFPITANNRAELDAVINQDEEYKIEKKQKNILLSQVEYLKGVVKIFEQRIWVIRALIDYEQKRG